MNAAGRPPENPPRPEPDAGAPATTPPDAPETGARRPSERLPRVIRLFSSMRLTVVVLLSLGVLTFCGTLQQQYTGLFQVQRDYFESMWVLHDTRLGIGDTTLWVPLPGGYLLMAVLFLNLVVGGLVRLRWRVRNAGILITHLGMALLLIAGFVKMHFSFAGHVALFEGRQTASMVSFHDYELALLRREGDTIFERTLAESALHGARRGTVRIDDPDLPFTLDLTRWFANCQPQQKGPMFAARSSRRATDAPTPVVEDPDGARVFLRPHAVDPEHERNQAGCYVLVTERAGGGQHRGILWGADFRPFTDRRSPFTFAAGGTEWGLDLRPVIRDLPFAVRLERFQKTDHPGTMTPRDFSSWVTVLEGDEERRVHIYMNHPLRKDGHVFFQTSWGPQPGSSMRGPPWWSVFEVAVNPSDAWPKYASYIVFLGLLLHFVTKLWRHLNSSSRVASLPEMS